MSEAGASEVSAIQHVAVTGANGHIGTRLIATLLENGDAPANQLPLSIRAFVRSEHAARDLAEATSDSKAIAPERLQIDTVDYTDGNAIGDALAGCDAIVHLVGIIKENKTNTYRQAHERTCEAIVAGAARAAERDGQGRLRRVVYLSIVGASEHTTNACLASKWQAEKILLDGPVDTIVLRVPMVLGEGDYASVALARRAHSRINVSIRPASLEQPIYVGDVVALIVRALMTPRTDIGALELGGALSLQRRALIARAANMVGGETMTIGVPRSVGMLIAALLGQLPNPPLTRDMLGVLDHDDCIDPADALAALGSDVDALTSLDVMLKRCISQAG